MTQWTESLWGDEGFSALAVMKSVPEMVGVVMRDTAPPLFYIVGWIWGRMFGFSEVSLRSLTLLLMLGAAIFAGLIVYEIGKDKKLAILGAVLAFLIPFTEPFAFEWRMYALLCFTSMGSVYFMVKRKWWAYIGMTAAAMYTHHFAIFTVAGEGLWFLMRDFEWKKPKTYLKQLWMFLVIAGLYLPWLPVMYMQIKRVQGAGFWLSAPSVTEVVDLMWRFIVGGVREGWRSGVGLLVLGIMAAKDWKKIWKDWLGLGLVFVAPIVLSAAVSYFVTPVFYDRYLLSSAVGFLVLIVVGTKKKWGVILLSLLLVVYGYSSWQQFTHPMKRDFRALSEYVKANGQEGDVLINYNGASHHLWESKYYGIPAPIWVPGEPLPLYVGTAQMTESDTVKELPEVKNRLGVISSEPVSKIELPGYKLMEEKDFSGINFSWWRKK